ncbi:MAG: protein kinase [Desulfobulbaceae bacterium]|nr:protein kinase [Desulfobulbaceae bacterium]
MKTQTVGKYTILKRLGKGGMGIVYKALQPDIDKVVAIKLLQPSEALEITVGRDRLEEIFHAEARLLADLQHPRLAAVWDWDLDEVGRPFFVMEYYCNNLGTMIGETFQLEQPSRPIRPHLLVHYGLQILDALDYLHHHLVVHRDIKPHNILVTDQDRVKICDFGMALADTLSFSGPQNMQIGSPYYTPPEQQKAPNLVDGRADCYSTAVLLYRLLTGTLPGMQSFPLSLINPAYDRSWDDFFHTGLQWDPALRFQSARAMQEALAALPLAPVEDPPPPLPPADSPPATTVLLRSTPDNQCGKRALERFGLNDLARPKAPVAGSFTRDGDIVFDTVTKLAWQLHPSPYPLAWSAAETWCTSLPTVSGGGPWRLPTVDELLSLLDQSSIPHLVSVFPATGSWFWSCDKHGPVERWYVNLDMGYAAPQDMDCRYHVRAVSSFNYS